LLEVLDQGWSVFCADDGQLKRFFNVILEKRFAKQDDHARQCNRADQGSHQGAGQRTPVAKVVLKLF